MCHLSAQPHTNIHAHVQVRTYVQHKMQPSVQRCAILAFSDTRTYAHAHIQHKMQLSVQRCAILTEPAKRCAILPLSHIQTYTHTCIQVHNIICSYISKDVAFRQRTLEDVPFLHSVAHKYTHAHTHTCTAHVAVCPKMCLLTVCTW